MSKLFFAASLLLGGYAMAEGNATPPPAETAQHQEMKKMDKKSARRECMKEHKGDKGFFKDKSKLNECISSKTM